MPIQSARIRFGTSRRRQKGSAPSPRRAHGRARCARDRRPDLGPDRPKTRRILAQYSFDNKWIFHIEFGAILGAFPGRPGGGDSARKEREGGAEPQGEDGGGARSARAGRAPCGERRSASGGAAAGRRPARCGRGTPPPAGPWASDVPDAPTEPPRGRSIKGAEAARRSLPQGGERRSGARRAKRRRAARTKRPRMRPVRADGEVSKIGRRGPECREASGARRRGERGATVTEAKADCTPPSRRDQADRRRAPRAAPGIPARSPRTPANRERLRRRRIGEPRRAQVPGRVLAAAVRPKRLDLLGTGANGTLGRFWRGTGQGGRDVGADNVWSHPSLGNRLISSGGFGTFKRVGIRIAGER